MLNVCNGSEADIRGWRLNGSHGRNPDGERMAAAEVVPTPTFLIFHSGRIDVLAADLEQLQGTITLIQASRAS